MRRTAGYAACLVASAAVTCVLLSYTGPAVFGEPAEPEESHVLIEPRAHSSGAAQLTSANIRVDSDLVLIPVTVTDRHDRFVTGLEKEHFKLYDDQVEQTITHFASEDAPLSVGVVFDCSSSMGAKLGKSREAVAQFLKTANPGDEFSLIKFADHAELMVHLTHQAEEIQNRLSFIQANGSTALLDAIALSMGEMKRAHNSRKALLIVSDGGDNSSRSTLRELRNRIREANVQIFAVGILEPSGMRARTLEELNGPMLLSEIAEQTGGKMFEVENLNELPRIARRIGVALRNQYVLGYSPANLQKDGKYHRVQVKLAKPTSGSRLRASWRVGYYAPNQ
jgi:Ca-activated chloride channel family protein